MTYGWKTFEIHIMNKMTFLNEYENTYLTTNKLQQRENPGHHPGQNTSWYSNHKRLYCKIAFRHKEKDIYGRICKNIQMQIAEFHENNFLISIIGSQT